MVRVVGAYRGESNKQNGGERRDNTEHNARLSHHGLGLLVETFKQRLSLSTNSGKG